MPTTPQFHVLPLTEEQGRSICSWRYSAPYDIYNWNAWDTMVAAQEEFADAKLRQEQYRAVVDSEGTLWGFAQLFPIVGVTRLGLGMRPDLCGQGYGTDFVQFITAYAQQQAPTHEVDLEVLTWNERAFRVYEKAGFVKTDSYERMTPTGMKSFYCMVYEG